MTILTWLPSSPPFSLVRASQTWYPCLAAEPGSEKSPVSGREAPIDSSPPPESLLPPLLASLPQAAIPRDTTAARATAFQPRRIETWDMLPPREGRNRLRGRQSRYCSLPLSSIPGEIWARSLPARACGDPPRTSDTRPCLQTVVVFCQPASRGGAHDRNRSSGPRRRGGGRCGPQLPGLRGVPGEGGARGPRPRGRPDRRREHPYGGADPAGLRPRLVQQRARADPEQPADPERRARPGRRLRAALPGHRP